jgi:deoxyribodipyrimidine photo-lyase
MGTVSKWWLHHSLFELSKRLESTGSRLVIAAGEPAVTLADLANRSGATAVFWNKRYEPAERSAEDRVSKELRAGGIEVESFHGSLLFDPGSVRTGKNEPFKVFTAFWNACLALPSPLGPAPAPRSLEAPDAWPSSRGLPELGLLSRVDRTEGIGESWKPGEKSALDSLGVFLTGAVPSYSADRDRPDVTGTSRLSPHLHFGEVSPRRVWHEAVRTMRRGGRQDAERGVEAFLRQVGWREFAHHLLYHFPHTANHPLRPEFSRFPWRSDASGLDAWKKGVTGYPMVDAGMRELWKTGWMHNRVRMVAASFLVKHLLIHWLEGARWFWDTLADADLANNTLGWQWTAGCGADAAPFFRVFNPVLQGEKFDPDGVYVRRWVPEIGGLPAKWIHKPWQAPRDVLDRARIRGGETYPLPIVDHSAARDRALETFAAMQRKK